MIDLSYKAPKQAHRTQPEEIACAVIAVIIWTVIILGWIGAF